MDTDCKPALLFNSIQVRWKIVIHILDPITGLFCVAEWTWEPGGTSFHARFSSHFINPNVRTLQSGTYTRALILMIHSPSRRKFHYLNEWACVPIELCIDGLVWERRNSGQRMMTLSNGNVFRVTGLLCSEFTGHRWIPLTKACDAELLCFIWFTPE